MHLLLPPGYYLGQYAKVRLPRKAVHQTWTLQQHSALISLLTLDFHLKAIWLSPTVNCYLTASEVPCLAAVAADQLTAVNASTLLTEPAPAFAVKGECQASLIRPPTTATTKSDPPIM